MSDALFPDRYIDDDVKLWRFQSVVLHRLEGETEYRVRNPIPVTAGGKLVGFASIFCEYGRLIADVAVDYGLPERLDVENGKKLYTLPRVEIYGIADAPEKERAEGSFYVWGTNPDRMVQLVALQIREDCTDVNQPAISEPEL